MVAGDKERIHWKEGDMVLGNRSSRAWGDSSQGCDKWSHICNTVSVCHIIRHYKYLLNEAKSIAGIPPQRQAFLN